MAYFNPKAIINIFNYLEMAQRHRITYNCSEEDAFIVYLPDKQVKFTKTISRTIHLQASHQENTYQDSNDKHS
jgi:hypothetical protein